MTARVPAEYHPAMELDQHEEVAERRRDLHRRRDEIAARLIRLRSSEHPTLEEAERAKWWAAVAIRHETDAHLRAADAHRGTATAHRRMAEYADHAGDHARAAEHRAAATVDESEAEAHTRAAAALRASVQS